MPKTNFWNIEFTPPNRHHHPGWSISYYVPKHQNVDWNIYDGNLKVCRLNLISILAPSDSLFEQEYMYNTCKLHQIHVVGNVHVISSSCMNEKTINLMNKLLLSLQETAPITLTTTLPILKSRNIVKLNLSIHFSWTWSVFIELWILFQLLLW